MCVNYDTLINLKYYLRFYEIKFANNTEFFILRHFILIISYCMYLLLCILISSVHVFYYTYKCWFQILVSNLNNSVGNTI